MHSYEHTLLNFILLVRLFYTIRKLVIFLNHIECRFLLWRNKPLIDQIHEKKLSATEVLTELKYALS